MKRGKLLFVINSLHTGGAERVVQRLLGHMGGRDATYDVHVALLDDDPQMVSLPETVTLHVLDGRKSLPRSVRQLRALVDRIDPDTTISFLVRANVANALVMRWRRGRAILCERMHLSSHLRGRYSGLKLRLLRLLPRLVYPRANRVLAVSEGVRRDLIRAFGLNADLVRTIFNPYDLDAIRRQGDEEVGMPLPPSFIVAVGRLVAAKNFAMLIDAYADAAPTMPLLILGEGEERARLIDQIAMLGLDDKVMLPGYVANPFAVMSRASVYVSASRNEGFPNGMAEAMVLGLPVLATDCPSGPSELLGAGSGGAGEVVRAPHGLIVGDGDRQALGKGLALFADPDLRAHYAAMARARMEDFRIEDIAGHYWGVINGELSAARGQSARKTCS